jgi:CelD/BcsL family acetyltransferase involved in cellulose biosynthesis
VFRSIRGVPLLESALDELNMASRRPSPFAGTGFLQGFLDHDEFAALGQDVLLLAAVEGDALVGFLPLRRAPVRLFGRVERKVEFVVTHDSDRPGIVARPEDEERCARAFFRHLFRRERFSVLELVNQEEASPLLRPLRRRHPRYYARTLDGLSTAIIQTRDHDFGTWFSGLDSHFRLNVGRLGRRLLGAGRVEWVSACDPRARLPLLELYLDLERRSWKRQNGLGRHPERVALHRVLCEPGQDLRLSFHFLRIDGAVIAGSIDADFPGVRYGMETCYDESLAKLGPGHLQSLLTIREAFVRQAPSFNLFGGYCYYKGSWGAQLLSTRTLQVFRAGSAHWVKALLGDVRRRVRHSAAAAPGSNRFNPAKRDVEGREEAPVTAPAAPPAPTFEVERELAERTLSCLVAQGIAVERLSGDALLAALPFKGPGGGRSR